jgi:DNA-binding LytR/AlgR family response regulator
MTAPARTLSFNLSGLNVLVAGHDIFSRRRLINALKEMHAHVTQAETTEDVWLSFRLESMNCDALVLDWDTPSATGSMDGYQLARMLCGYGFLGHIVFLTSIGKIIFPGPPIVNASFLRKPCSVEELARSLLTTNAVCA